MTITNIDAGFMFVTINVTRCDSFNQTIKFKPDLYRRLNNKSGTLLNSLFRKASGSLTTNVY